MRNLIFIPCIQYDARWMMGIDCFECVAYDIHVGAFLLNSCNRKKFDNDTPFRSYKVRMFIDRINKSITSYKSIHASLFMCPAVIVHARSGFGAR